MPTPIAFLSAERDGVHHRLPEADDDEQRDDEAFPDDHAHRAGGREALAGQRERDDGVDAQAGGERERVVADDAHGDREDAGDERRAGGQRDGGEAGSASPNPAIRMFGLRKMM